MVFFLHCLSNSTVLKVKKGLPWRIGVAKDHEKTAKSMRKDHEKRPCKEKTSYEKDHKKRPQEKTMKKDLAKQ